MMTYFLLDYCYIFSQYFYSESSQKSNFMVNIFLEIDFYPILFTIYLNFIAFHYIFTNFYNVYSKFCSANFNVITLIN